MAKVLGHRGPDDAGYWENERISLGMRRLSIIDLETGKQPVHNEDGSVWLVFNGEVYNYLELRAELEEKGHRFRTDHSDTEVLVHLYEEYGTDFLHKLNGMFAIALWDCRREELHLARDRAGVKPLYFAVVSKNLVFGSEIKSLLEHPGLSRSPNFEALHHYFSFKNVPAPWSSFNGIEQLRAGERAVFRDGHLSRTRWWRMRYSENYDVCEATAAEQIRELLCDSVRLRMRSDVPFGAFLSGGVDSSVVVALMSRIGGSRVRTFTLTYQDNFINKEADRNYAQQVSRLFDTEHYEHVMSYNELPENMDAIIDAFDEPFSGVTSTFFLSHLISDHVKVALSGDGADELFGSYLPHRMATPLYYYGQFKGRIESLTEAERALLRPFSEDLDYLASIYNRGSESARRMGLYLWDDQEKRRLYTDKMASYVVDASSEMLVDKLYTACSTNDPLNRALCVDFETLLPDQVLAFVDRLSMAHSVEVRTPFLDYRLMEYTASLPGRLKIKHGRVKHIFKEAMRGVIPDVILDRPKEGFVMPVNNWLLGKLRGYVEEILSKERLSIHGLLELAVVQELLEDHYTGRANNGPRIWNLVMFQKWWERYFG